MCCVGRMMLHRLAARHLLPGALGLCTARRIRADLPWGLPSDWPSGWPRTAGCASGRRDPATHEQHHFVRAPAGSCGAMQTHVGVKTGSTLLSSKTEQIPPRRVKLVLLSTEQSLLVRLCPRKLPKCI